MLLPENITSALLRLNASGFEAYVVGGCVRDLLMSREPHDWDITTSALPDEVAQVFSGFRVIATGIKHGTVTVIISSEPVEITTYRIDGSYSDSRRPDSVSFTRSLHEDLARRDFTVCAIAYSPEHGIVDPFNGQDDIKSRVIRCVGDANTRFNEDALRILRALRFASTLGFELEPVTSASLLENRFLLGGISAERINAELTKLLCGDFAGGILREYSEVFAVPVPELRAMFGFDQKNRHHCYDVWTHSVVTTENVPPTPELRWAALLHDIGKPSTFTLDKHGEGHFYGHAPASVELADVVLRRLKFNNASRERILLLIKYHDVPIGTDEKRIKRWLGRFGEEFLLQLTALKRADNLAQSEDFRERQITLDEIEAAVARILESRECFSLRDLDVGGDDLIALGYRGRAVGDALSLLLNAVIDGEVQNEKKALLEYLEETGL